MNALWNKFESPRVKPVFVHDAPLPIMIGKFLPVVLNIVSLPMYDAHHSLLKHTHSLLKHKHTPTETYSQFVKQLHNTVKYSPSQTTKVLVFAQFRSGSTFTSELFNATRKTTECHFIDITVRYWRYVLTFCLHQHPDVMYLFEPLIAAVAKLPRKYQQNTTLPSVFQTPVTSDQVLASTKLEEFQRQLLDSFYYKCGMPTAEFRHYTDRDYVKTIRPVPGMQLVATQMCQLNGYCFRHKNAQLIKPPFCNSDLNAAKDSFAPGTLSYQFRTHCGMQRGSRWSTVLHLRKVHSRFWLGS